MLTSALGIMAAERSPQEVLIPLAPKLHSRALAQRISETDVGIQQWSAEKARQIWSGELKTFKFTGPISCLHLAATALPDVHPEWDQIEDGQTHERDPN